MSAVDPLPGPEELDDEQRAAVEALCYRLADDELIVGERYTEWQVRSPTLESDLALSNIAQDEFGHARLWYDLLMDFGYTEAELIFERDPADFRHATLVELPFAEGDWADAIARSYLYDAAEDLRLDALEGSSYGRLAERVPKVRREERYHLEHAQRWLERLAEDDVGGARLEAAVERLFPYALTLFAPGSQEDVIERLDLRTQSLDTLRAEWFDRVVPFLESLEIGLSDPMDVQPPAAVGRDGGHTEHWPALHDEMTRTYRDLGRSEATRIMRDPDDVE